MSIKRKLVYIPNKISKYFSRRNLYDWLLEDLLSLGLENPKILCVGSGGDVQKFIYQNTDFSFFTIDIDSSRGPDQVMDATKMEFQDQSFDLILMLEVLEHIPESYKAIKECHRVLKIKGSLFLVLLLY